MHEAPLARDLVAAARRAVPAGSWAVSEMDIEIDADSHLDPESLRLQVAAALAALDGEPCLIRVRRGEVADPDGARLVSVVVREA